MHLQPPKKMLYFRASRVAFSQRPKQADWKAEIAIIKARPCVCVRALRERDLYLDVYQSLSV